MLLHSTYKGTDSLEESTSSVILLHGLFGMADNLGMVAKPLSESFRVYSLDLRNHGRSFRAGSMLFSEMAGDVERFMDSKGISSAYLIGHSLGGKVAMQTALQAPERVKAMVVADIAPVAYVGSHDEVFAGLRAIDLPSINSRRQAETILRDYIVDPGVRLFLMKSLYKDRAGVFAWRMNVEALHACYEQMRFAVQAEKPFCGPTLFIKGEQSQYITEQHRDAIVNLFPAAKIKIIQNTGHWLHAEKPVAFNRLVKNFLEEN
ncbi:MAG: esterase [Oceanicoccus sp.]